MKHKFPSLFLLVLLLLLLNGCACEHEWVEADCVNPQICAKCNESGEPALGHDWLAATCTAPEICTRCSETQDAPLDHDWIDSTCTAPETCSRCGETKGEALAHTYGEWVFSEDQMSHSCTVCNAEYTTAIDRELYLESLLIGRWDLWSVELDSGTISGAHFYNESPKALASSIFFNEDRSYQLELPLRDGGYIGTGTTWEFVDYIDSGDTEEYLFLLHIKEPSEGILEIVLHIDSDGMRKIYFQGANFAMWFYQEHDEVLESICTNWGVSSTFADKSYCFQLRPDGTAICYVEGIFEGKWYIAAHPEDRTSVGIIIPYIRDGQNEVFQGLIQLRGADISAPTMHLRNRDSSIIFHQVSDEELTKIQNVTDLFAGTWTSIGFGSPNPKFADPITSEYSIEIQENGKFTLSIPDGRTYSGNWSVSAFGDYTYHYHLYFTELGITAACNLKPKDEYPYIGIDELGSDANMLYFKQISK